MVKTSAFWPSFLLGVFGSYIDVTFTNAFVLTTTTTAKLSSSSLRFSSSPLGRPIVSSSRNPVLLLLAAETGGQDTASAADKLERLTELTAECLGADPSIIKASSNFVDDLGADSLDVIELVMLVENEFNISIEDTYASKIKTVQDALDYLKGEHSIDVESP